MTAYLVDTHIVIWAGSTPERLTPSVAAALTDPGNIVAVSSVSVAEMAIKSSLGKLMLPMSPLAFCEALGYDVAPLSGAHAERVQTLPLLHRDPFDRLLIAQAIVDDLTLITGDRRILAYDDVQMLANP